MPAGRSKSFIIGCCIGIVVTAVGLGTYIAFSNAEESSNVSPTLSVDSGSLQIPIVKSDTVQAANELENLLESRSFLNRELTLRVLLSDVTVEQLRNLLRASEDIHSSILRDEVQSIIVQKYSVVDPKDSLLQVAHFGDHRRDTLTSLIFQEWSSTDIDSAVDHAGSLDTMRRRAAVEGIATSRQSLSDERLTEIASRLGHEEIARDHIALSRIHVPIDSPEADWYSILADYGSDVSSFSKAQHDLLVHVLQSWIVRKGADIVPLAIGSLNDYSSRISTLSYLLRRLAENHPLYASSVAAKMLEVDRGMIIQSMETWAETDPTVAMEFASRFEDEGTRNRMQRSAIESWAQSNPIDLLESLAMLPPRFREWGQKKAIHALAHTFPALAAEEVDRMPDGSEKDSLTSAIVQSWFESDPKAVTNWAKTDPKLRALVEALISDEVVFVARSDPETALNMALQQSVDEETGVGYEALVVKEVARYDVEKAIDLLPFARNDQTRGSAYASIGHVLIQQGATERAMKLVAEVSPEIQKYYYRWISVFWLRKNAQEMVEKWSELPTKEIQTAYAELLLYEDSRNPFLSTEQTGNLETHLLRVNDDSN